VRAALALLALASLQLATASGAFAGAQAQPAAQPDLTALLDSGCSAQRVAQNGAAPTSAPSAAPSSAPSAASSLIPIPQVPPNPSQIIPPTPRPTGSATPPPPPLPTASPSPSQSGPVFLERGPSASPSPGASPMPTLGPYQIVTIADSINGSTEGDKPADLDGNVHLFYIDGQIVGDHAHFDGAHTIVMTGHTYLINRNEDSILYADSIAFDTQSRRAILRNGRGESTQAVSQGKIHYAAQQLTARSNGLTHGDRASLTTCEKPHGGYHLESRSLDVFPGDRIIARKVVVFLGPLAIFYLPLAVIPLRTVTDSRRQPSFIPLVGYSQTQGFYVKARIGFGGTDTYYGYYRVEYFTKEGLGLGYVAFIGSKVGKRSVSVDSYTIDDRIADARETNVNVQETENFSKTTRGQFGAAYQSDYGPSITLPATLNLTGSIVHQGKIDNENLTFSRYLQGSLSDNLNLGFVESLNLTQNLQQQFNVSYTRFGSPITSSDTVHLESDTHYFTKPIDYNLTYDKTDYSTNPNGYDKVPELQMLPHFNFHDFPFAPQIQLTIGDYTEPQNHFNTGRAEADVNEPVFLKFGESDFTANYHITQDYYATGDAKAYDQQNASLNTPIGQHIVNSLNYNEEHPIGPADVPFQLLDRLSPGAHGAQDTLRFFNGDVYSLSVSTATSFDRQAQPISYELTTRPSAGSYLVIGGYYSPGPGNGFGITNVQAIAPFGRGGTLEFTTNVDWKNKGKLESKNVYLQQIIGNCYSLQAAYNEDLKQLNFNVVILAFPSQGAGFGFNNQSSPILPQNFAF
jgi:hypothetical protein